MGLHRNFADRFDGNLRIVSRFGGIDLPEEIAALRQRLDDFRLRAFNQGALNAVVDGIITGDTDNISVAWAAACAEFALPDPGKSDLVDQVREKVNAAIRDAYRAVSVKNYLTIAALFDDHAQGFHSAAEVCDPTLDAEVVVAATEKVRKAWQASAAHAAELNRIVPVLRAAAELAGICGADPDDALDLCVDGNGIDRDQLLDAWRTEERESAAAHYAASGHPFTTPPPTHTRCGRWSALRAAGAIIRAAQPALAST
mgnify:CR=1 FL=1